MALGKKQFGAMKERDARKFTGMVGKQSKRTGLNGKSQGIHHHPMMSQLGEGISGGIDPSPGRFRSGGKY